MKLTKREKAVCLVLAVVTVVAVFALGHNSAQKDLNKELGVKSKPAQVKQVKTLTSDDTYHLESLCATFAYVATLDEETNYSITQAILKAHGAEDSLVSMFGENEPCGDYPPSPVHGQPNIIKPSELPKSDIQVSSTFVTREGN